MQCFGERSEETARGRVGELDLGAVDGLLDGRRRIRDKSESEEAR